MGEISDGGEVSETTGGETGSDGVESSESWVDSAEIPSDEAGDGGVHEGGGPVGEHEMDFGASMEGGKQSGGVEGKQDAGGGSTGSVEKGGNMEKTAPAEGKEGEKTEHVTQLNTRNSSLEGKEHEKTGVRFERKTVEDGDGNKVEGVFPQFESKVDIELPEDLQKESFEKQKAYLNEALQDFCDEEYGDPSIRGNFTAEELEDISYGIMPEGYVWHHNEEKGIMQLVDAETHDKTAHTGGMSIWGCGHHH
ncbi:MAG: HNH endonuclease [bacterium]|nr:HNH endonuclease [bacterium]